MIVYKYFKPQYLTANSIGMIHLSTFESIRKMEAKDLGLTGPTISDVNEGNTRIQGPIARFEEDGKVYSNAPDKLRAIQDLSIVNILGGTFTADENCKFIKTLPDAYMYSVTSRPDHEFWLSVDPDYKCCMAISDFAEFSRRLLKALKPKLFRGCQDICIYSDEISEPDYFRKKLAFKEQCELRSVFLPRKPNLESEKTPQLIPKTIVIKVDDLIDVILS